MKSLKFLKEESELRVKYTPSFNSERIWAQLGIEFDGNNRLIRYSETDIPDYMKEMRSLLADGLTTTIKHVFHFCQTDLVEKETTEETLSFCLGKLGGGGEYYVINGRILDIPQDVLVSADAHIDIDFFASGYDRRTSILKKISKMLDAGERQICIGTENDDSIPLEEYESLLRVFPNTTYLLHYGEKQIESHLQDYLAFKKSYSSTFENSPMNQSHKVRSSTLASLNDIDSLRLETFDKALKMLEAMLEEGEFIPENDWQQSLIGILPLLFPQYVAVLSKVTIKDVLAGKNRELDYLLVDATGNVDVVEIKRAFEKRHLLMVQKYRQNYIPARELRGGVFQIEKYIHLLLNWGRAGEKALTEEFHSKLPRGMKIRFLNPRGMLIMGHCELNGVEQRDFDLIRRQYSRVTDIITYDDLLKRLKRMMQSITNKSLRLG